jgi:hypothetical protein
MPDQSLTLAPRSTELSLADRPGSNAPRFMQLENKFLVEFWLFEDGSLIVWNDGQLSLAERSLALSVSINPD